ncbi:MAG: bacillithiol biosynthesis cysteine-adding enzyme BshC [Flavobacteriaceae bacterium]|nr:bacillithiol biosynthesis cysteine-adding enzyme BshC [Flavobacteriaceae bacterium]
MKSTQIPFQKTGFFSNIMSDYLEQATNIQPFYTNFSNIEGFRNQLKEKQCSFTSDSRKALVAALTKQYAGFVMSDKTQANVDGLLQPTTFTVTTGHQLNLFTGPLYFLYKIISAINLAEELHEQFPQYHFVPVYWMATEDHDFDEINFFNFKNQKNQWTRNDGGAVGRFDTEGLDAVFELFSNQLGTSKNAAYLKNLFSDGYLKHHNLADATRYITNELFAEYGLVIIDGDDVQLKTSFAPYVIDELTKQVSFNEVSKTIDELAKHYKIQVNPREINLFYLNENSRERIVFDGKIYKVNNTEISWSLVELQKEVNTFPERFSPNVIMRPLYQEVVLPNLAYIGGGGELAYWLELKAYFKSVSIPFPILLLRNSVQIISAKQQRKLNSLDISKEELFLDLHELLALKVKENSTIQLDFSKLKEQLKTQFDQLKETATQTDISFLGAVNAQEKKQLNGLEKLEKRLLRAEKRRQKELVARITEIKNQLFPNQSLEERQRNFAEYYLEYGADFIEVLKKNLKPLELTFTVLEMD